MRILIAGAQGLLGSETVRAFGASRRKHSVFAAGHDRLDLCDAVSVAQTLDEFMPDWVVNCAAATDVDRCEVDRAWAAALNFAAPRLLSEQCAERKIHLLQVSTDYVFDGKQTRPYTENDPPQPINYYGETKLCAELPVLEAGGTVVRTQWLYGSKKAGLIKRVLHCPRPRIIADCTGCPTWAKDVADAIVALVERNQTGLFHVSNGGSATWFDFAREVMRLWKVDAEIEPVACDSLSLAAKRPRYSVLDCAKLESVGIAMRDWRDALKEFYRTEGKAW